MRENLEDKYRMNLKNWPHQFTKDGKERQLGELDDGTKQFAVPMICVHCHVKYVNGMQGRPPDPCPARGKEQIKKILDVRG